jgi:pimeloyl-ACP methyl ester carboxylesterase
VLVLHGGPGSPGDVADLARGLSDRFRVIEPLQRRSGTVPLTVARHVDDLHGLVASLPDRRPFIVGFSWGAMLALAHSAEYPGDAGGIVLVGCGTFDAGARRQLQATLESRMDSVMREKLANLEAIADPDERLCAYGAAIRPLYSFDADPSAGPMDPCDARGHEETWADMTRLQREGIYPAAFAAITCPVLMLHGGADPHPGTMTRDLLWQVIPHLEYREWEECGHYPWLERRVRAAFLAALGNWIRMHS